MADDMIDRVRAQLAAVHPDLDTSGLAVTGRLLRLANRIEAQRNRRLEEYGLTLSEFDVLATLRRHAGPEGVKPRELHRSVMISSGGMTKRLDRLERDGLIRRQPDPDDRRGVLITLTDHGRKLIDQALPALITAERDDIQRVLGDARDRTADHLRLLAIGLDEDAT